MSSQSVDVLIIGAGISGIGAACHLKRECPEKSVAILERRTAIGGTWDLFRYPGIRSDSDMYTFGFNFRPWTGSKTLADGPSIKQYVTDTAKEYGVDKKIHFGLKVTSAEWSSRTQRWTVETLEEKTGKTGRWTAKFVMACTGYYNYDKGYRPEFPGEKNFKGQFVHPQHWPEDLDYTGKRVIIVGSGATAVTLLPAMADKTAHITMLQRSPTYMMSVPSADPMVKSLRGKIPEMALYRLIRGRNIALGRWSFEATRRFPEASKKFMLAFAKRQLKGAVDMRHFTPDYNPWDQRVCAMPDGDLFKVLRSGKASVATGHIETFTADGIRLKSGEELKADIVVTATGLDVQLLGGMKVVVDGKVREARDSMLYKAVLVEGIPNAGIVIGYTNASWTLRADLAAEYVCRLLKHMDKKGYGAVTPVDREGCATDETVMGTLRSGYVMRAADKLPKQGSHGPWRATHDYYRDIPMLRAGKIEDKYLEFVRVVPSERSRPGEAGAVTAPAGAAR